LTVESLKLKICKLFYQKDLSKREIGNRLKISRFKVTRLLEEALNEGLVKIIINEPKDSYLELENKLEEKFKIYRALVVDTGDTYEETKKNIGRAGAYCLLEMVEDGDVLGVAWGTTIYEMINALPDSVERKNVKVIQITGGLGQTSVGYESLEITRRLAEIFNARSYQLYAPAIFDNEETKKLMLQESKILETIHMFEKVNFAVVGLGSVLPEPSTLLYRDGYIKKDDFDEIVASQAVGNVNSSFYTIDGRRCKTPLDGRTIDMDADQLRRIRYVIALAGGKFKTQAVYGALKGKIVNIMVTDEETAQALLEM
jgi:DNA-binding transcriptional regulator LsrR (DeoR family)